LRSSRLLSLGAVVVEASQALRGQKVLPVLKVQRVRRGLQVLLERMASKGQPGQPAPMVSKGQPGHTDQPERTANLGLRVSRDQKVLRVLRVLREMMAHPRLRWLTQLL
jgi:hypothetical protein